MSERYSKIYRLPRNLYSTGAPVVISAGALLHDKELDSILAQLKFKNISEKKVIGLKVSIKAFDITGDEVKGVEGYQYLDFCAERNSEFGQKRAVYLPENMTRRFTVSVDTVIFEDGDMWHGDKESEWAKLPGQNELLDTLEDEELVNQYKLDTSPLSKYEVMDYSDLWLCSCGTPNRAEEKTCSACKCKKEALLSAMDIQQLKEHKRKRDRIKAKEKQLERQKLKRNIIIASILTACLIGVLILNSLYLQPLKQYNAAVEFMAQGNYERAVEEFEEVADFKDSAIKIAQCEQELNKVAVQEVYDHALQFVEQGEYENALGRISDIEYLFEGETELIAEASDQIKNAVYNAAVEALSAQKYEEAYDAFLLLDGYKDSSEYLSKFGYELLEYNYTYIGNSELNYSAKCTYEYDANGKIKSLTWVESYPSGPYADMEELANKLYLDENMLLKKIDRLNPVTGEIYNSWEYTYNYEGDKLVSILEYCLSQYLPVAFSRVFSVENDIITLQKEYNVDSALLAEEKAAADAEGKTLDFENMELNQVLDTTYEYELADNGKAILSISEYGDDGSKLGEYQLEYEFGYGKSFLTNTGLMPLYLG